MDWSVFGTYFIQAFLSAVVFILLVSIAKDLWK